MFLNWKKLKGCQSLQAALTRRSSVRITFHVIIKLGVCCWVPHLLNTCSPSQVWSLWWMWLDWKIFFSDQCNPGVSFLECIHFEQKDRDFSYTAQWRPLTTVDSFCTVRGVFLVKNFLHSLHLWIFSCSREFLACINCNLTGKTGPRTLWFRRPSSTVEVCVLASGFSNRGAFPYSLFV